MLTQLALILAIAVVGLTVSVDAEFDEKTYEELVAE